MKTRWTVSSTKGCFIIDTVTTNGSMPTAACQLDSAKETRPSRALRSSRAATTALKTGTASCPGVDKRLQPRHSPVLMDAVLLIGGRGGQTHQRRRRPLLAVVSSWAAATSPITAAAAPCRHLFLAGRRRRAPQAPRPLFAADGRLRGGGAVLHQRRHQPWKPSMPMVSAATSGTAAVAAPCRRSSLLWRRRRASPAPPPPLDSGPISWGGNDERHHRRHRPLPTFVSAGGLATNATSAAAAPGRRHCRGRWRRPAAPPSSPPLAANL